MKGGGPAWRLVTPVISVPERQSTCCPTGLERGREVSALEVLGGLVRQGV